MPDPFNVVQLGHAVALHYENTILAGLLPHRIDRDAVPADVAYDMLDATLYDLVLVSLALIRLERYIASTIRDDANNAPGLRQA